MFVVKVEKYAQLWFSQGIAMWQTKVIEARSNDEYKQKLNQLNFTQNKRMVRMLNWNY